MKFHHIGMVVKDIEESQKRLVLGKKVRSVYDHKQNANLALFKNFSDSYIELISPTNEKSYTYQFLSKNHNKNPYHHLCYEADEKEILNLEEKLNLIPITEPLEAKLFDNRLVQFFYTRTRQIVEFLILKL